MDPTGRSGPTKRQASGRRWRQTSPGLYVPSSVDLGQVEQRIFEQGHRIAGYGAVTGWAALRWRGAAYFDGTAEDGSELPVPIVTGVRSLNPDPRVQISQAQIAPTERTITGGIPVTTVQRALFDVMRSARGVRQAVVALDMVVAARLISVSLMSRYVSQRSAWTGVPLVREALALASDDSRSPQESRMRLVWVLDAGLPPPICNRPVFSRDGRFLGMPDLLDPEAGLVGEYDGVDHKSSARHQKDVSRMEAFREHGLECFEVVGGDLRDRPLVVRRMHSARRRASFALPDRRQWTLTPPAWWRPREAPIDVHLARTGEAGMLVRT